MLQIVCTPQLLPILNQEASERYAISLSPPAMIGLPLDEIEEAPKNARKILVRQQRKMRGRPVPLGSVKHVGEFKEEGESDGETIIRRRAKRFSHELNLAYENGQIRELKQSERRNS